MIYVSLTHVMTEEKYTTNLGNYSKLICYFYPDSKQSTCGPPDIVQVVLHTIDLDLCADRRCLFLKLLIVALTKS